MEEIVRYLGIDTRTQLLAERVWQLLEEPSGEIVDSFYRNTRRSAVGATLDEPTIERLKTKQIEHWRSLFNSGFDAAYRRRVNLVGSQHYEIGLDPKWHIAAYALMKAGFAEQLLLHTAVSLTLKSALIVTLEKYMALDMALALSSYSSWIVD